MNKIQKETLFNYEKDLLGRLAYDMMDAQEVIHTMNGYIRCMIDMGIIGEYEGYEELTRFCEMVL